MPSPRDVGRATLADVAREAGVCYWTARETFRTVGPAAPRVTAAAARRVLDAAERIAYLPAAQEGRWNDAVLGVARG